MLLVPFTLLSPLEVRDSLWLVGLRPSPRFFVHWGLCFGSEDVGAGLQQASTTGASKLKHNRDTPQANSRLREWDNSSLFCFLVLSSVSGRIEYFLRTQDGKQCNTICVPGGGLWSSLMPNENKPLGEHAKINGQSWPNGRCVTFLPSNWLICFFGRPPQGQPDCCQPTAKIVKNTSHKDSFVGLDRRLGPSYPNSR